MTANQFQWSPGFRFFDPLFIADGGILNGKVEGKWSGIWTEGIWLTQLKTTALTKPEGALPGLVQKLWGEFAVDVSAAPDQSWNASLKANTLSLSGLTVDGVEPSKLTGAVSPAPKKSHLILNYPKNKKWKPVRKDLPEFTW